MKHGRQVLSAAAAGTAVCLTVMGIVVWHARRAISRSEREVAAEGRLPVVVRALSALPNPGFAGISSPAAFRSAAWFDGSFWLAGPAGLFAWSPEGALEHVYRPGQDYPAAPLGALAVGTLADARRPELLIATGGEGVLAFDGHGFRQIRPADAEARRVTALLPLPSGRLLLGTARLGLLVYDGHTLQPFHATTSNVYVTALAGSEAELWIGTLNQGLLHWRGGETDSLGVAMGLPDAQIDSLALSGDAVYAGTPVGVAEIRGGRVVRVLAAGRFAHALAADGDGLYVGQVDEGVERISLRGPEAGPGRGRRIAAEAGDEPDLDASSPASDGAGEPASIEGFLPVAGRWYAVAANGLLEHEADGGWRQILGGTKALLADAHVSALLPASDGKLWVGYFDRGMDILPSAVGAANHVENDHVYCVNRIVEDRRDGAVAVATANGLVLFDRDGRQKQVLERSAGLIADHVTDVALYQNGWVAATPAGITFLGPGGANSLYAFEGLVNNHVYALGVDGADLLAGTLGGLSLLTEETVRRNFTTANSGLQHNWITSLAQTDDGWLIGTYGAGVLKMGRDGAITATDATRRGVVVNPLAIFAGRGLTLAGTLRNGLLVGDATGTRWRTVTDGLPSLNVTAVAADHGVVYVGTEAGLVKIDESRLR